MAFRQNSRSRVIGSRGVRRQTRWLDLPATSVSLAGASTAALILSLTAEELALRPFTIVRVRLSWFIKTDQFVASETQQAAVGMAVVSSQSEAIGATAVPTPFTDLSSDLWLMHDIISNQNVFGTGVGFDQIGGVEHLVDSKAMRKVEDGQDVVVVLETSSLSAGVNTITAGRVLIKMH